MSSPGSVTGWVASLHANNEQATQRLYERYLLQLMVIAKTRLRGFRHGIADEEDLAHQALSAFFERARQGGFPQLVDRYDVWQVLVMLTERRVTDHLRLHCRRKRGNGQVQGESAVASCAMCISGTRPLEQIVAQTPTPDTAAEFMDLYHQLMSTLDDFNLRQIAAWRIEGWTSAEIAQRIGCAPRTIDRKLNLIRKVWQAESDRLSLG